ncbi:septum formation initiator family protein [Arthrobacter sp. CDRTa11]|uniref:FtsB family cell division protein n=1 Tax=Arthrobacter sp. CDRTa11 TaxID=2651199 RepID=UPI002265DE77|nr:septum formation initiator family protein [Arthrobacter sp. CDRTa11]UZX02330.1 septum formation initiator family protein [Arthrobacter sp. CDRTa11]
MATRRPKVPKASGPAKETADTADIIRGQFGGSTAHAGSARASHDRTSQDRAARAGASSLKGAAQGQPGGSSPGSPSKDQGKAPAARAGSGSQAKGNEPEDEAQPVPAKAFSGRMLALAVVMIAITIMLAPTVKIFFDKRAEIAALNADIAASQAEQASLRQQVSRWQDPNYVKQQARDRINMVMPGETSYWVFGSDLPAGSGSGQTGAASQDPADLPWVDSLWESIRRAATD